MSLFTSEEINLAQKVEEVYGVPASITLAQYGLESGYGKYTVGQNNYFNIKGNGTGGYRDYSSKEESFMDFGKLLTADRYTSKTAGATTEQEYIQGVKDAGYAEDSQYVDKVMSIINSNDLTQYQSGSVQEIIKGSTKVETITGTPTETPANIYGLNWWGDVVMVIFTIAIIIAGVAFLGLALTNGKSTNPVKSKAKEVVKKVITKKGAVEGATAE